MKKKVVALEELEEFEEDTFDDDPDLSTSPLSTSPDPASPSLSKSGRHSAAVSHLSAVLAQSDYRLRVTRPSQTVLLSAINTAQTKDDVRNLLPLLASWKSKGLAIPRSASSRFAGICLKVEDADTAIVALSDRATYGLEIMEDTPTGRLFTQLLQHRTGKRAVKQATILLELEREAAEESTISRAGNIVLALLASRSQEPATAEKELKKIKAMGDKKILPALSYLTSKAGKPISFGKEPNGDLAWLKSLSDSLPPRTAPTA